MKIKTFVLITELLNIQNISKCRVGAILIAFFALKSMVRPSFFSIGSQSLVNSFNNYDLWGLRFEEREKSNISFTNCIRESAICS